MNTNSHGQLRAAAAAVTGSRHLRLGRNGQDAAAAWTGQGAGAVVVCDGCGSGASSEVGARLWAQLVIGALARRLEAGQGAADPTLWCDVRADVANQFRELVRRLPGALEDAVHEHFLFTIVAAAVTGDQVAVWALGDGAYAVDGGIRVLGPFADNQPPYLAYDLLGMPATAHLEVTTRARGTVVVATDGVAELGLEAISLERGLAHPDGLRRQLALFARSAETIEWEAHRIARTPALLQDDGAVAILEWRP